MKTLTHLLLLLFGLATLATPAFALETTLDPVAFNTIYEDNPTYASGVSTSLFFGPIASGSPRRILVKFDFSTLPAGAVVTAATLRLNINRAARNSDFSDNIAIHRLLASWGQGTTDAGAGGGGNQASAGDATWNARFYNAPPATPSLLWASPGGDFQATPSYTAAMGVTIGTLNLPATPGLVADVSDWLANPGNNQGWIVIGPEGLGLEYKARRVDSISLTVNYELAATTVPALGPAAFALATFGLMMVGLRLLRHA